MNTKDYWELSEKGRAMLTQEEVDRFADYELMQKGVLRAQPLELEPEPEVPAPTQQFFRVKRDSWHELDIAFRSAEDAQAFLRLRPVYIERAYCGHVNVESAKPLGGDVEVTAQLLRSSDESNAMMVTLKRAGEIKASNAKRREEHEKAQRAQEEALVDMWSDWRQCRAKLARIDKVVATFDEYRKIADDIDLAGKFLLKAFPRDEIVEAASWHGFAIPLPEAAADETPKKAPALAEQQDDVAF